MQLHLIEKHNMASQGNERNHPEKELEAKYLLKNIVAAELSNSLCKQKLFSLFRIGDLMPF